MVLREHDEIFALPSGGSLWDATLQAEPLPHRMLRDAEIDDALLSAGAFTDLVSPAFTGHSASVRKLWAERLAKAKSFLEAHEGS